MKIILAMAQSANGYIAKTNHQTPWSNTIWKEYTKLIRKYKALIVGHNTYAIMKKANEFKMIRNPFTVVVTRKHHTQPNGKFVFAKTPRDAIKTLQKKKFHTAILGGGSRINAAFMKQKLVNEIILDVEPKLFGSGIPLFKPSPLEQNLELLQVKRLSKNTIRLHYELKTK